MSEMGAGEMGASTNTTQIMTPQEHPAVSTPPPYSGWAAAFQAYYGSGTAPILPPGYFRPSVGSAGPQPHPFMWGAQHLMPPYGTPPLFAAMYTHGGMYGPPSIPLGTHPHSTAPGGTADPSGNTTPASGDGEGRLGEGKFKGSMKRSKGSLGNLGMLTGKGAESGKNGTFSNSNESGSEGSTEGSEGTSQNGSDGGNRSSDQGIYRELACGGGQEKNHVGSRIQTLPMSIAGQQVMGVGSLTNLNIGMDYWNGGAPAVLAHSRNKQGFAPGGPVAIIPSGVSPGGVAGDILMQDERELKRQRRKQSNRESARRSRLRKQSECEELGAKVLALESENTSLRGELTRITEQCSKLTAENTSLREQMQFRGTQPEFSAEMVTERNNVGRLRGERRNTGNLQKKDHFRRDTRVGNDVFSVANEGGNVAVAVSSG